MRQATPAVFGALLLFGLQACGDEEARDEIRPPAAPDAAEPATDGALGLTRRQLEDADLVGTDGVDLGDVERVLTGPSGQVEALEVEVDQPRADRRVRLPLDGLEPVRRGDDLDLRTAMTRDQLLALPESRP